MSTSTLSGAVLFLVFNRLDTTRQVMERIREARPARLYVAADGPRAHRQGEAERVQAVRDHVLGRIDWPCEVRTLFREENLGCKHAVSQAINWFFTHEDEGIILEDDCLPDPTFFDFCWLMLERYRHDLRVWQVCGSNFDFGQRRDPDYSYHFSYYGAIWGWATWRDRWQHYDVNMGSYPEIKRKGYLLDLFGNAEEALARAARFDHIAQIDTWDFQWAYARFVNSGLAAMPDCNLVANLGFGDDATHTHATDDVRAHMQTASMRFPLRHPPFVIRDKVTDDRYFRQFIRTADGRLQRLFSRLRRIHFW